MEHLTSITKVQQKLARIRAEIEAVRMRLTELDLEAKKLTTTLEVLQNLGAEELTLDDGDSSAPTVSMGVTLGRLLLGDTRLSSGEALSALFRQTTRQIILSEFVNGESLTRIEVLNRLQEKDNDVNAQTVASTLSKLTAEDVLEKEGNAYRLKVATPSADDTESGHDLC